MGDSLGIPHLPPGPDLLELRRPFYKDYIDYMISRVDKTCSVNFVRGLCTPPSEGEGKY